MSSVRQTSGIDGLADHRGNHNHRKAYHPNFYSRNLPTTTTATKTSQRRSIEARWSNREKRAPSLRQGGTSRDEEQTDRTLRKSGKNKKRASLRRGQKSVLRVKSAHIRWLAPRGAACHRLSSSEINAPATATAAGAGAPGEAGAGVLIKKGNHS